jgi:hypothetical protein
MPADIPAGRAVALAKRLLGGPPDVTVVSDPESWTLVKEAAPLLGVSALIAYNARTHLSGGEKGWCDQVLMRSRVRHEQNLRDLERILEIFDDAKIPVISLKGPLLARRYYEPFFLRKPSSDIDIAVKNADLERAHEVLIRNGYHPKTSIAQARLRDHHVAMAHPERPTVELHFRLSHQALGIPVEELFERAVTVQTPVGRDVLVLEPADQLLHVILHFAQRHHEGFFLPTLCEAWRLLTPAPLSQRIEAVRRAAEHRFAGAVTIFDLACLSTWGRSPLSPEVQIPTTWLHPWMNEKLYRAFERRATLPLAIRRRPAMKIWGHWLNFRLTDGPRDALRALRLTVLAIWFRGMNSAGVGPRNSGDAHE